MKSRRNSGYSVLQVNFTTMSSDLTAAGEGELRQKLVNAAVKFLTNTDVILRSPQLNREKFLRSKGLTEAEIRAAVEKASEHLNLQSFSTDLVFFRNRRVNWFRDNVLPVVIYGTIAYGCYWFYKNWLRRALFVERPAGRSTSESVEELRRAVEALGASVEALRGDVRAAAARDSGAVRGQLDALKGDVASVKGILLNRNQFPSLKTRTEPPSIPAWQRQGETEPDAEPDAEPTPAAQAHRARSQRSESGGSNSSEGEHATKNSDSSLEIIRWPSHDRADSTPLNIVPEPPTS